MNESVQLKASSGAEGEVVGEVDKEAVPSSRLHRMLRATISRPLAADAAGVAVLELGKRWPPWRRRAGRATLQQQWISSVSR